jgi:hypothetical protein
MFSNMEGVRETRNVTKFWSENSDDLEDLSEDGSIILKLVLKIRMGGCGLGSSGSGTGTDAGSCKQ